MRGNLFLSLQLSKILHEPAQQIAAVTRTTPTTNRPQKTSAPAFIPYNAAPPIPAILSPTVDKKPEYTNKNFATQTPKLESSPAEQEPIVQSTTLTHDSTSVAFNSQSVQATANQGTPSDSNREDTVTDSHNEFAVSGSLALSENDLEKPTDTTCQTLLLSLRTKMTASDNHRRKSRGSREYDFRNRYGTETATKGPACGRRSTSRVIEH